MNLDPYLTPYTKMNSKWVKDLNVRPKTIKLLEQNTGEKLHDHGFDNDCLDWTPKALAAKSKIYKWDYVKLKNVCSTKELINRMKSN